MNSNNTYILVEWPESQTIMDQVWFKNEAILCPIKPAAYFIPESRLIDNNYILNKCKELANQLESTEEEEAYIFSEWDLGTPFDGGMSTFESVLNIKLNND